MLCEFAFGSEEMNKIHSLIIRPYVVFFFRYKTSYGALKNVFVCMFFSTDTNKFIRVLNEIGTIYPVRYHVFCSTY